MDRISSIMIVAFLLTISVVAFCAEESLVVAYSYIEPNRQPPDPESASTVTGTVRIEQAAAGGKTSFVVDLKNVGPPFKLHGFHIHENDDIYSEGCQSTGAHYNPFGFTHGAPSDRIRHVGDLGNVETDADGNVHAEFDDHVVSLVGEYSVLGHAFVIHALTDDLGRGVGPDREESLKTGNAGARLGCGVIKKVSPLTVDV